MINSNYCRFPIKSFYIAWVQSSSQISYHQLYEALLAPPLYAHPWWMDATCGVGQWDAVVQNDREGKSSMAIPFYPTKISGISAIITPPLTQWVAVLLAQPEVEQSDLSLLSVFPKSSIFDLSLQPDMKLHLKDKSFIANLKYSYILPKNGGANDVRSGYNEGLRRNIRQAEKNYTLQESDDIRGFLSLCRQSYRQQKMKPPGWLDHVVTRVYEELLSRQCGMLTTATYQGRVIAGILTGWDQKTTYYLSGGRTSDDVGASAHALLLDQAVQAAHRRQTAFDFEGSMHPGIANFFQSFGAKPIPYWRLRKYRGAGKLWSLFH